MQTKRSKAEMGTSRIRVEVGRERERAMFSLSKFQGITGGHNLGGACDHNKAHGLFLFSHQSTKVCWSDMS